MFYKITPTKVDEKVNIIRKHIADPSVEDNKLELHSAVLQTGGQVKKVPLSEIPENTSNLELKTIEDVPDGLDTSDDSDYSILESDFDSELDSETEEIIRRAQQRPIKVSESQINNLRKSKKARQFMANFIAQHFFRKISRHWRSFSRRRRALFKKT